MFQNCNYFEPIQIWVLFEHVYYSFMFTPLIEVTTYCCSPLVNKKTLAYNGTNTRMYTSKVMLLLEYAFQTTQHLQEEQWQFTI